MDIAIASGKGGTGKTTLAVNLASYITNIIANYQVVLVDLDVEEPNSGLFINGELVNEEEKFRQVPHWIEKQCTLCGKCQSLCQFNAIAQLHKTLLIYPELCHSCFACSDLCPEQALPMVDQKIGILRHYKTQRVSTCEYNFSFVESILRIGEPSAVALIQKTKEYIKDNFPGNSIKIYDCPPGTSCPVIEAVKDVDYTILVTEPTPFGLHDLKLAVETMKKLGSKFGVVINRHGIGNKQIEEYCRTENIKVLAKVPDNRQIAEKYSTGKLIYKNLPEVKNQLKKIVQSILRLSESYNTFNNPISKQTNIKQIIEDYKNCSNLS